MRTGSDSSQVTSYRLADLRIVSELSLSGLLYDDNAPIAEVVTIRRASVPVTLSPAPDNSQYDGKAFLLTIPNVARYLIRDGREILVDQDRSADKNDVRAYLMGSAFGTLCHQRGILPLHSAAIDVQDGCIALAGPSGAGKSTVAAALHARRHQVIADDVTFLQLTRQGAVHAWPGIRRIRLWQDALIALGCNGPGIDREYRGYNKYLVPTRPLADPFTPRHLRAVYQLATSATDKASSITLIEGASAIESLLQNVYCASSAECMHRKSDVFKFCLAIAKQVPIFRFSRPVDFQALFDGVELLVQHMHDMWCRRSAQSA